MQARDAWINPSRLVDALGSQGPQARSVLAAFPALAALDYKAEGRLSMPDRPRSVAQIQAQLEACARLQQRDLRQLGLLVAQMLLRRALTPIEARRLGAGGHGELAALVDNLPRAPAAVQALLRVCFAPPQAVERSAPPGKFAQMLA